MTGKANAAVQGRGVHRVDGCQTAGAESHLTVLDDIARHVDGAFVLVVKVTAGRYRRRCFLTVKAAEDAARRATELKPLWKVRGGERP